MQFGTGAELYPYNTVPISDWGYDTVIEEWTQIPAYYRIIDVSSSTHYTLSIIMQNAKIIRGNKWNFRCFLFVLNLLFSLRLTHVKGVCEKICRNINLFHALNKNYSRPELFLLAPHENFSHFKGAVLICKLISNSLYRLISCWTDA